MECRVPGCAGAFVGRCPSALTRILNWGAAPTVPCSTPFHPSLPRNWPLVSPLAGGTAGTDPAQAEPFRTPRALATAQTFYELKAKEQMDTMSQRFLKQRK